MRVRATVRGFSLIEVMVALVIFSVGLLGMGKMLLISMKANSSSYSSTQAWAAANAMLDRIRANRATALSGSASGYSLPSLTIAGSISAGNCESGSCSGGNLATYDVATWLSALSSSYGLPSGEGQIVFNQSGGQTLVTITVAWDDSIAQQALKEAATAASISLTSGL